MKFFLLAVNGTLMRGFPLNKNLKDVHGKFVRAAKTSPNYRLWSIEDRYPAMQKDLSAGNSIELEIWELSLNGLIALLKNEPEGLCLGKVELEDGISVLGILGENYITRKGIEISGWGGWRKYISGRDN
jgi:gamma-glutamylcyclotransferase (GGCT)/AIG2-like uncharacterized protein YtfP